MSFRHVDFQHLAKFNSDSSSKLVDIYENEYDREIREEIEKPKHKTFAPSAIRCPRLNWFRLRGTEPDNVKKPDRSLQFTADIGNKCHELIQSRLSNSLKENWIDVSEWIESYTNLEDYELINKGYETLIEIKHPPVRFACDGIVKVNETYYLLEIKSSEMNSFRELTEPKPQHIEQTQCYCTLLNLSKVLFVYIDRSYGDIKCYETTVSEYDKQKIQDRFESVMNAVDTNLPPDRLPHGDSWCTPSHCPWYNKCKSWGG